MDTLEKTKCPFVIDGVCANSNSVSFVQFYPLFYPFCLVARLIRFYKKNRNTLFLWVLKYTGYLCTQFCEDTGKPCFKCSIWSEILCQLAIAYYVGHWERLHLGVRNKIGHSTALLAHIGLNLFLKYPPKKQAAWIDAAWWKILTPTLVTVTVYNLYSVARVYRRRADRAPSHTPLLWSLLGTATIVPFLPADLFHVFPQKAWSTTRCEEEVWSAPT